MAADDPLLCSFTDPESVAPVIGKKSKPTSLDDTIEHCIGELRWTQFFQSLLVSCAWIFDAQQCFISIFTDSDTAGDLHPVKSIISDFSLQNASSLITGLPASSFFIGCLAGGILLTTLADSSMGRKNMLFISCLFTSLSGLLTIVSTNIWCYSVLRFLCGFFRGTIGTCALVLSTELVGKRWRGHAGIVGFLCFAIGFLTLPAIAYLNRGSSWRMLYIWTCIPNLFYCLLIHFLVHESPRWLFVRGRKDEFISSMKSLAPASYGITSSFFSAVTFEEEQQQNVDAFSAMKILFAKPWALKRMLAVMSSGFGIGMLYYGMPLGIGSLGFNVYLGVTLDALSELPSLLVVFFLIDKINRKSLMIVFTSLGGLTSIGCVATELIAGENNDNKHIFKMVMQLVSFFSACTAFDVLLIYTLELFPTSVRNSAVSLVRQALVFGGVFSPLLVAVGRKDGGFVSYVVFGISIGICGLFTMWLPETRGEVICDTMDEEERKTAFCVSY
ncbi:organic cation/carnitine transporter 3 [Impatiens glandulifera]|uniref:organic cation/carnitine transporter 3 n=1 Tax=Impatiens glandulifera TaxID=253017 RepID=UPI001FB17BDD|nr:organic cation/carnitine transporter 3 [Impatiens glandulifera]